jgi:hypothetical protein
MKGSINRRSAACTERGRDRLLRGGFVKEPGVAAVVHGEDKQIVNLYVTKRDRIN